MFLDILQRSNSFCKTKIAKTGIFVIVEKDIFRFDVSMDDLSLMQVIDSFKDLSEDPPLNLLVSLSRIFHHKVFKSLSVTILHLNVEYFDPLVFRASTVCYLSLCTVFFH